MKILYRFLFGLHLLVGVGAMAGGMAAILNPQEPLGMSVEPLKNSPFTDYLIPGIILFAIVGLGSLISAIIIPFKWKFQGYLSSVSSWGLAIWIIVQVIIIKAIHPLHIIFFSIGVIEAALSAVILFKQVLFPANIVINLYEKLRKAA